MEGQTHGQWFRRPKWSRPYIEEPFDQASPEARKLSFPWTVLLLLVFALLGFATSLVAYFDGRHATSLASTVIWAVSASLVSLFRPRTSSLTLTTLYVAVFACQTVTIFQLADRYGLQMAWNAMSLAMALSSLTTTLNMPLRHPRLPRTGISKPFSPVTADLRSPEDNLTMWQWMTVSWMAPLISLGATRQLNDDDVWLLGYEFQHTHLHRTFRSLTGSVVRRLIKANWLDLLILTLLALLELAANYSAPIILQQLLQAMRRINIDRNPAITWALLTLVVEFVAAQSGVFSLWFGRRAYERSRGEMITMLHEKVLNRQILGGMPTDNSEKEGNGAAVESAQNGAASNGSGGDDQRQGLISGTSKKRSGVLSSLKNAFSKITSCIPSRRATSEPDIDQPASMGKILNLMRNDVYETAQRFWEFQSLINTPVGLVLSLVLVWRLIGWSSLIGIAVIVVAQIINAFLARILLSWEKVRRKATDHKLQQISQYVEAIRHLRWYGWHLKQLENVMSARQRELNLRIITFIWNNAIRFVNAFASGILPVAAFWAYTTLAGQQLSVDIAFPALRLFDLLHANLRDLPNLITVLLNAAVAVGRIEDFMGEPDIATEDNSEFAESLELKTASFAWPGLRDNVLHKLNLTFPCGLTVVVGPVASGKTALLQALLGELDLRGGQLVRPDAPIAYCAQTPWLESMTIRDNILFCSPYDDARYKQVLEACALLPDLAFFNQGDLSPIGENGIGLSGGQKARVALARAVYSRAQYLLLDDPLSSLDQQTAEWIVQKCFMSSLTQGRTVLLVTHRTDLCQGISDQVVEVSEGEVRSYKNEKNALNGTLNLATVNSASEQTKQDHKIAADRDKFEDEEHRAHGGVRFSVYWEYIKAGRLRWWWLVVLAVFFWRFFDYCQSWFLKEWGEAYKSAEENVFVTLQKLPTYSTRTSPISHFFDEFPDPAVNPKPWLMGFMILVILQCVALLTMQVLLLVVTYQAGKNMFARIMTKISNTTFHYYDVTPVGRLMNRLTGDVGTVDGQISTQFMLVTWEIVAWGTSIIVIAGVTPLFSLFSFALAAMFVYIFLRFLPTSQSLRRLEMVSLSPLMSNFGALLTGLMTVRAFHAQSQFQDRVISVTDAFQKMDHFYWSLQSWLQYRFDILSAVSTFLITVLAVYSGFSPGLTAFVLIAAQRFVASTHRLCRQYGQLQLDFVSVERVVELLHLEQEDPGTKAPPASWPALSSSAHPAIEFRNVTIRYAPHLDPALKNISFSIPSGTSTAVIGRTGSGKSTLALALLATTPPDAGQVLIDGVDIFAVSKQALRSRITFLAQDPILFPGTLRTNLDPFLEHSEAECGAVIARIHGDVRYGWTPDTAVDVGGKNLSQGQRQLVGLARAILRRSAIVVMDEATASVDLETSWEVQRALKEELAGSTVVTIAHRASAVRDCGLVVKLDKGELVDFGEPSKVDADTGDSGNGESSASSSGTSSSNGSRRRSRDQEAVIATQEHGKS